MDCRMLKTALSSLEIHVHKILAVIAISTCLFHFGFGLYYVLKFGNLLSNFNLHQQGSAYLGVFSGWNTPHEGDSAYYNRTAVTILETGVPRDQYGIVQIHAPVYSYFLAGCYGLGGVRFLSIIIPQAILAGLIAWLVGLTAMRLTPQPSALAGIAASLLILTNLRLAMMVGYISPTLLLLFFTVLAAYFATSDLVGRRLAGFVAALTLMVFTQAAAFVVVCGGIVWLLVRALRTKSFVPLIGIACLGLLIGARLIFGMVVLQVGGNSTGENASGILWEANNPYYASMTWRSLWERRPGNPWTHWQRSAEQEDCYQSYLKQADQNATRAAMRWIRENPGTYAKLCFIRLRTGLGPFTGQMSPRNRLISTFYWLLIVPAGVYGLWWNRRQPLAVLTVLMIAAYLAFATFVIVEWYLRYRLPVELVLMVFAGVGWRTWLRLWQLKSHEKVQMPRLGT